MRDELAEEKEKNAILQSTLLSLQDKYVEVCQELRKFRENKGYNYGRNE